MTEKTCTKCNTAKPKTEFYKKSGGGRDRLTAQCRECIKGNIHAYQIANADRRRAQQKEYRESNTDKIAERNKRQYLLDPAKAILYTRGWRQNNKFRYWFHASKRTKIKDGKVFELDWPDIKLVFELQNYCCALTGIPFYSDEGTQKGVHSWSSPSMDRLDYKKGYTIGNVRIVLFCINSFRGRMTDNEMYTVAEALLANRPVEGVSS